MDMPIITKHYYMSVGNELATSLFVPFPLVDVSDRTTFLSF